MWQNRKNTLYSLQNYRNPRLRKVTDCSLDFAIILGWILRYFVVNCWYAFSIVFWTVFFRFFYGFGHENGAEVVPQNGHKSNPKSNLFPLGIIFGISVHFGINLVPFWHTFGVLLVTLGGLSVPIDAVRCRFSA